MSGDHSHLTDQAHVIKELVAQYEIIPPHAPREETPEYKAAHHALLVDQDAPCAVCGVTHSLLQSPARLDPASNPFGATQMESHHRHIMRSLADACDPAKVAADFPDAGITDPVSLLHWVDSIDNLIPLCDVHHRSTRYGVHHVPMEIFLAQRYFYPGYVAVAADAAEAKSLEATDEAIELAHGEHA